MHRRLSPRFAIAVVVVVDDPKSKRTPLTT